MHRTRANLGWSTLIGCLTLGTATATTFTVTSTADGAGTCPSAGSCTLYQAITDANNAAGDDVIAFAIPGAGAHTIMLSGQLPAVTGNLVINGSTQSLSYAFNTNAPDEGGINAQPLIEINGNGQTYGLYATGNVTWAVEHLVLNGFGGTAIAGEPNQTGGMLTVRGCFIGTKIDGTAFALGYGNGGVAIRTGPGHAQIGGTLPGERNLISGNSGGGILVSGPAIIEGNLIGPDVTATLAIGNGPASNWPGIYIAADAPIVIGCSGSGSSCANAGSRNVISGNHVHGIGIWASAPGVQIKGNYIGTDWTGTKPLPNGDATAGCPTYCSGIQLQNGAANPAAIIGGFNPGEANLIAFNHGPGIWAYSGNFDSRANAIHHNSGPVNISLMQYASQEPLANDAGDADAGVNNRQNSPEIVSASISGGQLHVTYRVDSTSANSAYPLRIDFHANVHGGSGDYIGQDAYLAGDAQLDKTISLPVPVGVQGIPFVATATDANGYTSEFSAAYDVIFEDEFE